MMVKTRLWLAGEVSEHRDMPLIRQLIARVRRCAMSRPLLLCTDGLSSYVRAMRETFRDPMPTGSQGRPRLRPWRHIYIAQVVKRYAQRHMVDVERRIIDGTPARVETLRRRWQEERGDQPGIHRAAQCHVPGALGVADTSWAGAGASSADAAAWDVYHRKRLQLLYVPCQSAPRRLCGRHAVSEEDSSHGRRDHRSLLDRPGTAVVSGATATLDTPQAAWAPLACAETPSREVVLVTTVNCRATTWFEEGEGAPGQNGCPSPN